MSLLPALARLFGRFFSGTRTHQLSDYAKFAVNDTTQRSANCLHLTTKPQPIRGIEDGMCACTRGREMIQSCDSRTHRHAYERASGFPVGLGDASRASNSALSKWRASMTGVGDAVDNSRLACKQLVLVYFKMCFSWPTLNDRNTQKSNAFYELVNINKSRIIEQKQA